MAPPAREIAPAPGPLQQLRKGNARREQPAWLNGTFAGVCLYLFLCAINIMGDGLGMLGKSGEWLHRFLAHGDNPFVALMGSVIITAVVQSSSFTTALIVTLVAAGQLDMEAAVYAIMGANIGTSVTGIIVSLGNIRIKRQFRKAFTAALMHDIFNLLTVALLFPLEWISGIWHKDGWGWLTRSAMWAADSLGIPETANPNSPIKIITRPMVVLFRWLGELVMPTPMAAGLAIAIAGLILLMASLIFMVKNLKGALLRRVEGLFRTYFFRNDGTSYAVGVITTILVQSSSITTSLIVPLAGAGVVKMPRVFAFMLGANLGTTITGVIAATAHPAAAAVTVAIFHVTFNLIGTLIWYPLRRVPMSLAQWYGSLASESKRYAFLFLFLVFVLVPLAGVIVTEMFIER